MDSGTLAAIVDSLLGMDCAGLIHYDLKPANILINGRRAGFLDFEFSRFECWADAYAPGKRAFCDDFNVGLNPHFPARSNLANFEFRTLSRYCQVLDETVAPRQPRCLRAYLGQRSRYHFGRAAWLSARAEQGVAAIAAASGQAPEFVRISLGAAVSFEQELAELTIAADDELIAVERSLMDYRRQVFERDTKAAGDTLRRLSSEAEAMRGKDAYVRAVMAAIQAIGRSRWPETSCDAGSSRGSRSGPVDSLVRRNGLRADQR